MLFTIKKIQEILDVMSETVEGDEIYAELTQTRHQLIEAFTSETSGLQTQQAIEYREDCIGMLNFDATCLAKKFKMPEEVVPAAPVLGMGSAPVLGMGPAPVLGTSQAKATPAGDQQPGRAVLGGQGGVVLGGQASMVIGGQGGGGVVLGSQGGGGVVLGGQASMVIGGQGGGVVLGQGGAQGPPMHRQV